MNETSEPQPNLLRGQFPLWVLLFVVPTVIAISCALYLTFDAQAKEHARLLEEAAVAKQALAAAENRRDRLNRLNASLDIKQAQWRSPESIVLMVKARLPRMPGAPPDYWEPLYLVHPSMHFYIQATDDDLKQLVARLIEVYPDLQPEAKFRALDCLAKLPNYFLPHRVELVRPEIQEFAERLGDSLDARLRNKATQLSAQYSRAEM
ncbi:hypothetical protein DTL21_20230 [Bremerella cremea]|uniref:Uncharacterized protein n=1 Tax=Blastopirellula marina TaxID=124 RepID=A0A2S8FKI5_9BACT|nr:MULTISPECIES: hypothetical protein [Pirellulaceae]PQO32540.1 hypothetical protein C5Y83_20210 [Blastopirellula marina]RCS45607.1 hypothetical protein DTL21_20230 [Bremerella cremea]